MKRRRFGRRLVAALGASWVARAAADESPAKEAPPRGGEGAGGEARPRRAFLDNGVIRIGVDLESGAGVFHFGAGGRKAPNLLNHYDRGRLIQQSFYGKPDGSRWGDKPWRWNPVQGGHYEGAPSTVEHFERTGTTLHARTIPRHWAGGQRLDEVRMEEWITLDGPVACLRFRFTFRGGESHPVHGQEMPAVFADFALRHLVRYEGDRPWTGGALTRSVPGWPNESARADESWAAWVGDDDRGIGVAFPGTTVLTTYRYQGEAGPEGSGCSYFAPVRTFAITPGTTIEYEVFLTLGTIEEIRGRFHERIGGDR